MGQDFIILKCLYLTQFSWVFVYPDWPDVGKLCNIFTMTWHIKIYADIGNYDFSRYSEYQIRIWFKIFNTLAVDMTPGSF